jgi:hypothetical protein
VGEFLASEKLRLTEFKSKSAYFTDEAHSNGVYKDHSYPHCLPVDCAEQNLFPEIREKALNHFQKNEIKWHDGQNGKPSNHLCDSQVCCVNFLFPFVDKPSALKKILTSFFPSIKEMLPVEDGLFVSFEWIGEDNYLCEKISNNGKRSRGANFTSADSIVMFERTDHKRQILLIEWKYTESYGGSNLKFAKSGTDRTKIYKCLYDRKNCPIDKSLLPSYDSLFYEPFYQLMRQQLLAREMEKEREMGADIVSVLHIAPNHNTDFRRITSPELVNLGDSAIDVWKNVVKNKEGFISASTEKLFGNLSIKQYPEIKDWIEYISARYPWVNEA